MAEDLAESLSRFNLFADLGRPQLEAIADPDWERWFSEGERVLRHGISGGDFFGEVSTLLGAEPTADVIAAEPLHCLEIPGPKLEAFLLDYPRVMLRMLQTEARRLQEALEWRS
jgi:Cyclic nucleotide-binding domain